MQTPISLWNLLVHRSALFSDLSPGPASLIGGHAVFCGGLWCWSVKSNLYRVTPLPKAVNTPLSSQPLTHTHSQTLYKPGPSCCFVPTDCGGFRPENKFGKLTATRAVSHRCIKAFSEISAQPRWVQTALPSGLSSVCRIQRNADAAISGSTITAGPLLFVCRNFFLFFFYCTPCVQRTHFEVWLSDD